jgi:O-antigen/teichoic acid export membrane protein
MSVKKNFLYNVIYQILNIVLPIITVPYISRVIGADGIGINAYTFSIAQYFILFGTLGIGLYGSRTIAFVRDDEKKLRETFWSIAILQISTTSLAMIIYLVVFLVFDVQYKNIYFVQSIGILASSIDITWFFSGLEQFKKTVTRNIVVKILGLASIFIFVKEPADVWKYALINVASAFLGQLVMWYYIPSIVGRINISKEAVLKHLKPSFSLFIPQIAVQIYIVLDKTMIGMLANKTELGYYENSEKIIKMTIAVVTSLGAVMLPRLSNIFANKDLEKIEEYNIKSFKFVNYLSIPLMFGMSALAFKFAPWFFGIEFKQSSYIMIILSIMIPAIAWSNVTGMQYLLPSGKVNSYTVSVCLGAVVNFVLNLFLISTFKASGAAVATVITEYVVAVTQLYICRNDMPIKKMFGEFSKFMAAGILMFICTSLISYYLSFNLLYLTIEVAAGAAVYFIALFILRSETNKNCFSILKNTVLKKIN